MNATQKVSTKWAMVTLGIVGAAIVTSAVVLSMKQDKATANVHDFESCVAAGNPVMESYPEQCAANGNTYTNERQQPQKPPVETSDYIGLSEEAALKKAQESNTAARVVQRDDEALPITMDFVFGRHNLYIENGKVTKVEIEGQASDSPMEAER